MKKGYVVDISDGYQINEEKVSKQLALNKGKVISLADYLANTNTIDAQKVIKFIFPAVNAEIFISHSHKDLNLATQLAIDLQEKFGVSAFVDSCLWGCSSDLLRIINKKFCKIPKSENYSYDKTMRASAHVNMILTTALQAMIYEAPVFIFLSWGNSVDDENFWEDGPRTYSAWIHMELKFSELLSRDKFVVKAMMESFDDVSVIHSAPTSHLTPLTIAELKATIRSGRLKDLHR